MILILATKFLLYIFLLLLGVWLSVIWKTRRIRHETSHLHHSKYKPLPLIGHLHHFINRKSEDLMDLFFNELRDAMDKGIQTGCICLGPLPIGFVRGAEDVQKILTSTATNEKAEEYKHFKFFFGNGLVTAPNRIWKIKRSHTNPAFHPRNVEMLTPALNRNCRELVIDLSSYIDSGPVNVLDYTMKAALKSITHLTFGPEFTFNKTSQEFDRFRHVFERMPEIGMQRFWKPWLFIECIFNHVHKKDLSEMENVIKTLFETSLKDLSRRPGKHPQRTVDEDGSNADNPFVTGISLLQEAYRSLQKKWEGFTNKDLMDDIATLYITGIDTVGVTVSSCFIALAQYPDIQDKLFSEIELFVDDDEITPEQIEKMQYLDQVINETLRISNVVPVIGRKCTEDLKLSECTIPAGNTVAVLLSGVHMDPKVYPNPDTFHPERFSPENSSDRGKHTFLPFSRGPRNCIGKSYAQLLVKLMVVHVVRQYKLFTDMNIHTMKMKWAIALISSEGYNIKLQSRIEKSN